MVGNTAISLYLLRIQRDLGEFEIRTLLDLKCAKSRKCVAKCVPIKMAGYTMGTQIKGSSHKRWGQKEKLTVT